MCELKHTRIFSVLPTFWSQPCGKTRLVVCIPLRCGELVVALGLSVVLRGVTLAALLGRALADATEPGAFLLEAPAHALLTLKRDLGLGRLPLVAMHKPP